MTRSTLHRRDFLWRLGLGAAGAALATSPLHRAAAAPARSGKYLFVITAYGGGDITDSFLPVATSQIVDPKVAATLRAYPDAWITQPKGSAFKCLRNLAAENKGGLPFRSGPGTPYELSSFIERHGDDMAVVTVENTSVNHVVGQGRALTGDSIDGGRTILEAVAETHGADLLIPNCNMSNAGFTLVGARKDTPDQARGVQITDAGRFALGTHGYRGLAGGPSDAQVKRARGVRARLEAISAFAASTQNSELRSHYLMQRDTTAARLEQDDLIRKLLLVGDDSASGGRSDAELAKYGLARSPDFAALRARFPQLGVDELHDQAALAFLLAKYGIASSVAFGLSSNPRPEPENPLVVYGSPVAFDFSHVNHVTAQNANWPRLMEVVDSLITLLKGEASGDGSMWDRSLVYVVTEFGRTKDRAAGSDLWNLATAHDLSNGVLLISPLIKGNRVYGGIDPDTMNIYGYDPRTGDPDPGSKMTSGHVYSLICQALGVEFSGRHDVSGLLR